MLQEAPGASLSDTERSALHRDLWTELTTSEPRPARSARWAFVTAGGLVAVAVIAVLGQLGTGGETTLRVDTAAEAGGAESPVTDETAAIAGDAAAPEAADTDLAAFAMQARQGVLAYEPAGEKATGCVDEAGLGDLDLLGELEEEGRRYAVLVPDAESFGPETPIVFVDLETCEVAHRDG
jgi:hypothetical protein